MTTQNNKISHDKNHTRFIYLDEISELLILVMVIIHICSRFELESTVLWLKTFYFFMSWFYFKSGMFHRNSSFSEVGVKTSTN